MKTRSKLTALLLLPGCLAPLSAATISIAAGTYTENFDAMAASGSAPAPGWAMRLGATASTMGNATTLAINAPNWSDTGGAFRNISSSNIDPASDPAAQAANGNRAVGFRQVGFGGYSPGMSLCFNFATDGVQIDGFSLDMLQLNDAATRVSTYTIQYGFGTAPTSFTTLGTWTTDGTFGATSLSFDRDDFGTNLDGKSQVWLRVVALTAATGSGSVYDLVGLDNFSISASAVPEPSAALLGALGVFAFFQRRRR